MTQSDTTIFEQETHSCLMGAMQHPDTGLWQVWLAVSGRYAFLTALKSEQSARLMVEVLEMDVSRDQKRVLWLRSLFDFLAGQSYRDPLPSPSPGPWALVEKEVLLTLLRSGVD